MDGIPTLSKQNCTRWSISRSCHLLITSSCCFFHFRSSKLHFINNQYKAHKHETRLNPSLCMSGSNYSFTSTIIASSSRSNYNIINRPKSKYLLLRPCRRGLPNSISTPVLIFWTPRNVYINYTWVWDNLTHHQHSHSVRIA